MVQRIMIAGVSPCHDGKRPCQDKLLGAATGEINAHLDQHFSRTSAHHQTLPTTRCATRVEVPASQANYDHDPLWFSAFPQLHDSAQLGDSRLSFKLKSWLFFQQYGTVMLRYYLRETVLQV
jgi:hypothetical protein